MEKVASGFHRLWQTTTSNVVRLPERVLRSAGEWGVLKKEPVLAGKTLMVRPFVDASKEVARQWFRSLFGQFVV
jgi:hypothetical protein